MKLWPFLPSFASPGGRGKGNLILAERIKRVKNFLVLSKDQAGILNILKKYLTGAILYMLIRMEFKKKTCFGETLIIKHPVLEL